MVTSLLFIPGDNDLQREEYERQGGGCCGPAAIAALLKISVAEVEIDWWKNRPWLISQGWMSWKDVKRVLEIYGYVCTQKRGKKSKVFPIPQSDEAIVRIQWLKPDGSEYYWAEATRWTHFILMKKIKGEWWIFCNLKGWFKRTEKWPFEDLGYITSYYELSRTLTVFNKERRRSHR